MGLNVSVGAGVCRVNPDTPPDSELGHDFEGLFAVVRPGNKPLRRDHAHGLGAGTIEGAVCLDEGGNPAAALGFAQRVHRQRRLPAGLGPVDLDDAPPRVAADPERMIERMRACREGAEGGNARLHDTTLSELLLNRADEVMPRVARFLIRHADQPFQRGFRTSIAGSRPYSSSTIHQS